MKIAKKIFVAPALAIALVAPVLFYGGTTMQAQRLAAEEIAGARVDALQSALQAVADFAKAHTQAYRLLAYSGRATQEVLTRVRGDYEARKSEARNRLTDYAQTPGLDESSRGKTQSLLAAFTKYAQGIDGALDVVEVDAAIAAQSMQASDDTFRRLETELDQWVKEERKLISAARDSSSADYERSMQIALVLSVLALGSTVAAGLWVARRITLPLRDAAAVAERLADGELVRVPPSLGDDEAAALVNALSRTSESLRALVHDINQVASGVSVASRDIAAGNRNVSERTGSTAAALQQTAATMDQLSSTVSMSVQGAANAASLAERASRLADASSGHVAQIVASMRDISESSHRITEITAVIDGIAFQTNILALNAAVEAARAGDHGRGFAVVASEVRELSKRSATAARDIASLIRKASTDVATGHGLVDLIGSNTSTLTDSIRELAQAVRSIAESSEEQSVGIREVSAAVASIDQNTQQNAALIDHVSTSADSLTDQTSALLRAVGAFRTPDNGAEALR